MKHEEYGIKKELEKIGVYQLNLFISLILTKDTEEKKRLDDKLSLALIEYEALSSFLQFGEI